MAREVNRPGPGRKFQASSSASVDYLPQGLNDFHPSRGAGNLPGWRRWGKWGNCRAVHRLTSQ